MYSLIFTLFASAKQGAGVFVRLEANPVTAQGSFFADILVLMQINLNILMKKFSAEKKEW